MKTINQSEYEALPEERRKYWEFKRGLAVDYYTPIQINLEDAERVLEEAMQVAKLFDLSEEQIADTDLLEWIEALFTETAGYYIDGYTGSQLLYTIDYLRSIGVLLPLTYLNEDKKPVTLSVDELIGMKWAIVKK